MTLWLIECWDVLTPFYTGPTCRCLCPPGIWLQGLVVSTGNESHVRVLVRHENGMSDLVHECSVVDSRPRPSIMAHLIHRRWRASRPNHCSTLPLYSMSRLTNPHLLKWFYVVSCRRHALFVVTNTHFNLVNMYFANRDDSLLYLYGYTWTCASWSVKWIKFCDDSKHDKDIVD